MSAPTALQRSGTGIGDQSELLRSSASMSDDTTTPSTTAAVPPVDATDSTSEVQKLLAQILMNLFQPVLDMQNDLLDLS